MIRTRAETVEQERLVTRSPAISAHESSPTTVPRFWEIDAIRGIAIVMMVLYHLIFDLDYFGGYAVDASGSFWRPFATVTAFLFVFIAGASLTISSNRAHLSRIESSSSVFWKNVRRGSRVFGYGMLITIVFWLAVPNGQIYFGILHVIGLSVIVAYPFMGRPVLALVTGVAIVLLRPIVDSMRVEEPWLLWLGIRAPVGYMFDYRPMIPWFGVALLGIAAASLVYRSGERVFPLPFSLPVRLVRILANLGQYSLVIYLAHQPVLLTLLYVTGIIDLNIF